MRYESQKIRQQNPLKSPHYKQETSVEKGIRKNSPTQSIVDYSDALIADSTKGESYESCFSKHEPRAAGIECDEGADNRERAPGLIHMKAGDRVCRRNKIGDREEQEGQNEEEEHTNDGPVCSQGSDEEHERQETPYYQVDTDGEREGARVTIISALNIERGHQKHRVAEPERAVRAVYRCAKGIPYPKFHNSSYELRKSTHKDSQAKDSLIRTDRALWIGVR